MQLRSRANTTDTELLSTILDVTTRYMDDYFGAYYVNAEPRDYFSSAALTIASFGIHGVPGRFTTAVELDGILNFNADPAPSQGFIDALQANAFEGLNLDLFLENLIGADNEFLGELTHIIIEIDDYKVTEENLQESQSDNSGEESDETEGILDKLIQSAIYLGSGVAGALFILALSWLLRCCCGDNRRVDDNFKQTKKPIDHDTIVRQLQREVRRSQPRETFYSPRERSPSPLRSLSSQDSSKFTYNPGVTSMPAKARFSVGNFSNFNIDTPGIDIEAWQRQDAVDLSQIEEGVEPRESGQYRSRTSSSIFEVRNSRSRPKSTTHTSSQSRRKSGAEYTFEDTHIVDADGRSRAMPRTRSSSQSRRKSGAEYIFEDTHIVNAEYSNDVISDLRDLSLQIDRHRRSRSRSSS